jgi:SAM-dependent MidA family methyltransferase
MPATDGTREGEGGSPVQAALQRWAQVAGGRLPWERFMEIALYDPSGGYYQRRDTPFGRAGDFYTAAHLGPALGRTLARWLLSIDEQLGRPDRFRVVELGAGDGTLGQGIREGLRSHAMHPERFEYTIVERSAARETEALERIRSVAGGPVSRQGSIRDRGPFVGAVVAHELFDALPARSLIRKDRRWWERTAVWREGRWEWDLGDPWEDSASFGFPEEEEGTVREVSPAGEALLRAVADHLQAGAMVILDYGGSTGELGVRHPFGSVAALRRHRGGFDPLESPGTSDLSVYVDFDRLRAAARRAGFQEIAYRTQAEALGAWGIGAVAEELQRSATSAEERVRLHLAIKNLLFGFERFRVLELSAPRVPLEARASLT